MRILNTSQWAKNFVVLFFFSWFRAKDWEESQDDILSSTLSSLSCWRDKSHSVWEQFHFPYTHKLKTAQQLLRFLKKAQIEERLHKDALERTEMQWKMQILRSRLKHCFNFKQDHWFFILFTEWISTIINNLVGPFFVTITLFSHSCTHLSGIMFSIHNVFWSHRVVWSKVKVKLNSSVNIV